MVRYVTAQRDRVGRRAAAAMLVALAVLLLAAPAHAATFRVNTTDDSTVCNSITCSLRGALLAAQANGAAEDDLIVVPAGVYATPEISLTGPSATRITIEGNGANTTFLQPAAASRVLNLTSGAGLTLRRLTVRGGRPATGTGGNIAVSGAALTLVRSRVTNGQAAGGGGISVVGSGPATALTVAGSLIDNNNASGTGTGGGILMPGQTFTFSATITDSTIAYNTAAQGGGIAMTGNLAPTLRGVTIAFNRAREGGQGGFGGIQSASTAAIIQGSIIAGNTTTLNFGPAPTFPIANCAFSGTPTDQGGNIEDAPQSQCGFTSAASRQNTNPGLATALDESQEPPVLAIPETSPAVNLAACDPARPTDQRGFPRPLGAACDAGAYEFDPRPDTVIGGATPPFAFTSSDAGSTFQCSLDGAPFTPCASPYDPGAAPGTHTLAVRAVDPQGNADASPATVTFTVAAPPIVPPTPTVTVTPAPTPVVDKIVVARPVRGTVRVKRPGSRVYETLDAAAGIPVRSSVDTRKGRVELTSIPRAGAPPEKAVFYDGLFRLTQARGITNLTLTEALAPCPRRGRASAAARRKTRKLWGDGKGAFRTSGKYSAATVRGTKWLVQDSCSGTLTRVTRGSVSVRDKVKRRTIVVRAGKRYLARPRQ